MKRIKAKRTSPCCHWVHVWPLLVSATLKSLSHHLYVSDSHSTGYGECLLNEPASRTYPLPSQLPGLLYNVNKQCELIFGPGSQVCPYMVSVRGSLCPQLMILDLLMVTFSHLILTRNQLPKWRFRINWLSVAVSEAVVGSVDSHCIPETRQRGDGIVICS